VGRYVILASASGSGKTTVGRALAQRRGIPFVELDALVHGPGWTETGDDELRRLLAPILAEPAWVVDGSYSSKLGTMVLDSADTVVWLDLPIRVWFPRLVRRTARRVVRGEELWNGNRETLRGTLWGRESLFVWAFRSHVRRRRAYPRSLAGYDVVRLRTPEEVTTWLETSS
jgi:adenylate kinase family enzyme